ncbi:hypothetical protein [Streptomyces sp. HB2AG]|uniref:hypothetical protein n=1 Tax=Streptomyces sp. HB2AG TaxID=2983400 RepID=UPI0022AAB14A|nr:hypothetical protein [Streptomyces sp. HB2AG]MCZ2523778.1 hypothetical protein [Streptomyces sp. HB2AG]
MNDTAAGTDTGTPAAGAGAVPRRIGDPWAQAFAAELKHRHSPPPGLVDRLLEEVAEAVAETGRPAEELFGPAAEYADLVAAERIDETHRSVLDLEGRTPAAHFRQGLVAAGAVFAVLTAVHSLTGREEGPGAVPLVLAVPLYVLLAVTFAVFPALRAAGRVRAAWGWSLGVAVTTLAGAAALARLPAVREADPLGFPLLTTVGCGVLLGALALLLPEAALERLLGAPRGGDGDDEQWLRRLGALLRGRHGVPVRAAQQHVAEAREHLAASGGSARQEFGPVEVYAMHLTDGPGRAVRRARRELVGSGLSALVLTAMTVVAVLEGETGRPDFWVRVALCVLSGVYAASLLPKVRAR